MIPHDYITEWRAQAPWIQDFQVEQDLVICRALVAIFAHPLLGESLAFRGGTALYKLYLKPPARYSEDIDLVQINAGPADPVMEALRETLDPWLGKPQWKQTEGRVIAKKVPRESVRYSNQVMARYYQLIECNFTYEGTDKLSCIE